MRRFLDCRMEEAGFDLALVIRHGLHPFFRVCRHGKRKDMQHQQLVIRLARRMTVCLGNPVDHPQRPGH